MTPAQMLMSSFSFNASLIPGSLRTSMAFKGLQPMMTMSAAVTPERLSCSRIWRGWLKEESLDFMRDVEEELVTQAMNLEGSWAGVASVEASSLFNAEKIPESMAVPRVPHPRSVSVSSDCVEAILAVVSVQYCCRVECVWIVQCQSFWECFAISLIPFT